LRAEVHGPLAERRGLGHEEVGERARERHPGQALEKEESAMGYRQFDRSLERTAV